MVKRLSASVRLGLEVERDVGQQVLLAADELAAARLDEDVAGVHAVPRGRQLRVSQEAAVDACVAGS